MVHGSDGGFDGAGEIPAVGEKLECRCPGNLLSELWEVGVVTAVHSRSLASGGTTTTFDINFLTPGGRDKDKRKASRASAVFCRRPGTGTTLEWAGWRAAAP